MTAENTITGRAGCHFVGGTSVARTTRWSVNSTLATKSEWGDCDSEGYTNRAIGRRDGTYDTEGKYDTGSGNDAYQLFDVGIDYVASTLWIGASTTLYWHFPRAICMNFSLSVDADTEEVVGWSAGFGADGIFYAPGDSGIPVQTRP